MLLRSLRTRSGVCVCVCVCEAVVSDHLKAIILTNHIQALNCNYSLLSICINHLLISHESSINHLSISHESSSNHLSISHESSSNQRSIYLTKAIHSANFLPSGLDLGCGRPASCSSRNTSFMLSIFSSKLTGL